MKHYVIICQEAAITGGAVLSRHWVRDIPKIHERYLMVQVNEATLAPHPPDKGLLNQGVSNWRSYDVNTPGRGPATLEEICNEPVVVIDCVLYDRNSKVKRRIQFQRVVDETHVEQREL